MQLQYRWVSHSARRAVHLPEYALDLLTTKTEYVPSCLLCLGGNLDLDALFLYLLLALCGKGVIHIIRRSLRFITPGADEVVLRFFPSSTPATPESTLDSLSDVSADIMMVLR